MFKKIIAIISVAVLMMMTGCSSTVQTTSGRDYLSDYGYKDNVDANSNSKKVKFSKLIEKAASVEPILKFPARIGLVRLDNGNISPMSMPEFDAWEETRKNLGKEFGEFIPLSPLIAEMVGAEYLSSSNHISKTGDLVNMIRLGAARQHLHAVLIYEVFSNSTSKSNILSIANLSIIGGYILPSEKIESVGIANAMLIDVMQGYPYGTVQTRVEKDELTVAWGVYEKMKEIDEVNKVAAGVKLTTEVEEMFKKLRWQLAEKRAGA